LRAADADSVTLPGVQGQLREFRAKQGHAPTADDFLKLILRPGDKGLPMSDRVAALEAFAATQHPSVEKSTIVELHRALRQSMDDMRMTVVLRQQAYQAGRTIPGPEETHEFAFSGRKLFLRTHEPLVMPKSDTTKPPSTNESSLRKTVRGYDEELVRVVDRQKRHESATINHLDSRSTFYRPESNILFGSMLLDSRDAVGMELTFHDLLLFLDDPNSMVFETPETIDGCKCICVGIPGEEVWLDPERNFAVLRFRYRMPGDDGAMLTRYVCDLSEFKDCGNGLWLPRKMVRRHFAKESGSLEREEVATVTELHVNEGVPDPLFHDVIPAGTVTHDAVKGLAYIIGKDGSIESLMDLTTDTGIPPVSNGRIYLVIVNMVVFACVGTWAFRNHFRKKV
jgi:hypothetical protein